MQYTTPTVPLSLQCHQFELNASFTQYLVSRCNTSQSVPAKTVDKKSSKIINGQTKLLKNLHLTNTVLFCMHVWTYIDERGINIVGFFVAWQYDTWVIIWNNQEIYLVIISINELHLLDIEISNLTYMLLRFRICFWECWMIALRYPSWKHDRLVSPEIWNGSIVEFYCSRCGLR
jgi:hypothetical protein